jgi:hypothetical protein
VVSAGALMLAPARGGGRGKTCKPASGLDFFKGLPVSGKPVPACRQAEK